MTPPAVQSAPVPAGLLHLNVNGLNGAAKRRSLFAQLLAGPWDVVVLVETHCSGDTAAHAWVQEGAGPGQPWRGHAFWAHGTSASRGVAVLLHPRLAARDPCVVFAAGEGRVLRVEWQRAGGRPMAVLGVYAPTDRSARIRFLAPDGPVAEALAAGAGAAAPCLVAGDFNCVPQQRDVLGAAAPGGGGRMCGSPQLGALMTAHGLVDAWRSQHPWGSDATHVAQNGSTVSAGRIDQWWVPSSMVHQGWVRGCQHLHGQLPGDHSAVHLQLVDPGAPPRGAGMWALPLELLAQEEYVGCLRAAAVSELAGWEPLTEAQRLAPARARWEAAKLAVQGASHSFEWQQRRRRRQSARAAAAPVAAAWRQVQRSGGAAQALAGVVQQQRRVLQQQQQQQQQQTVAAEAAWAVYGEQGTSWFHRLGRQVAQHVPLTQLRAADGSVASLAAPGGKTAMDAIIAQHFGAEQGGLFAPQQADRAAQAVLLAAVDTFVPTAAASLCAGPAADGSITLACAAAALAKAALGKSPGCDGLPYEVYAALWDVLAQPMVDAWNEAFADPTEQPELCVSQRTGVIVLIHKGDGKSVDELDSFRPITLLNADYKLLARVLVARLTPAADAVVDRTQTAFLPGRWIGDNILQHLEEVDYCAVASTPGVVMFLDFAKAYDSLDRRWLQLCMRRMRFPAVAQRWVALMLQGTQVQVRYHGWHTPMLQVQSGCAQGSPLSPLMWALAAQPLAARLRQLQRQGRIDGIPMPGGGLAPPSHQHADDTTVHTASLEGAAVALEEGVRRFSAASTVQLNVGKSKGMLLGGAAAPGGEAAPLGGMPFPPPDQPIRHLGVLLSADAAAAAEAMFERRRAAVEAAIQRWAQVPLSYLGRLHVAKQVLAASVYFHATFVQPPPAQLASIVRLIDYFVEAGALADGLAPGARGVPGVGVERLPRAQGGLGRVHVELHIAALQAKVAAAALHPHRQPWKQLLLYALGRAFPAQGAHVLVSQQRVTARHALSSRQAAYCRAFQRLRAFRLVAPHRLTAAHVRCEPLRHNAQVAALPRTPLAAALEAQPEVASVGDVAALWSSPAPLAHATAAMALAALPEAWREHALPGARRGPVWEVSPCGTWAKRGNPTWLALRVLPDGRLAAPAPGEGPPPPDGELWQPAAVVFCPCMPGVLPTVAIKRRGGHLHGLRLPGQLQPYLLGAWRPGLLDPNAWGIGMHCPLSHMRVRDAAARMLVLEAMAGVAGYALGAGVRPRLWADPALPDVGMAALERRLASRLQERLAEQQAHAVARGRRRRRDTSGDDDAALYDAPWMHPSRPRAHPLQRAAAAQAAAAALAPLPPPGPRVSDCVDVAALPPARAPPSWREAYAALWAERRLPRDLQWFGWRLLHGALACGAWRVPYAPADAVRRECMCSAPGCVAAVPGAAAADLPLETYTHMFVTCPTVVPAVAWLCRLGGRILGAVPPPDPLVIILGDPAAWRPQRGGTRAEARAADALWMHVRLRLLQAIWRARCVRAATPDGAAVPAVGAAAVVAMAAAAVEQDMRRDWHRVQHDVRSEAGVSAAMFAGHSDPMLTREAFEQRWCVRGVLASVVGGVGRERLVVSVPRALLSQAPAGI